MFLKNTSLLAIIFFPLFLSSAGAQESTRGKFHWRPAPYDTATVQTITGRVITLERFAATHRRSRGIHALLKSDNESIYVYLAPRWHLKKQDFRVSKGDTITVTGSRELLDGRMTLVAAEIRKGQMRLKLRERDGTAAWWKTRQ